MWEFHMIENRLLMVILVLSWIFMCYGLAKDRLIPYVVGFILLVTGILILTHIFLQICSFC